MENVEKDMTPILIEDLGMRYPTEISVKKKRFGVYQCQYCGKEFEAQTPSIKSKHTKSCGCQSPTHSNQHGLSNHPIYNTWKMMKHRCYNIKHKSYKNYGGGGIKVCDRWLDVRNFIEDMYPSYVEGLTLDRIDVNGNYEIDNCRWADANTQAQNTKDICKNNTSGYRGVYLQKGVNKWVAKICVGNKQVALGSFQTALEAGKAYERYVRINNLEHNFTPALNEEEILELEKLQVLGTQNVNSI